MGGLLTELGKKLAERWLTLLVLPGALYIAALLAAASWRHAGPVQVPSDRFAPSPAAAAVLLVAFLLGSATCGLAAQALGSLIEHLWLAVSWPVGMRRLATTLTAGRHRRWTRASDKYREVRDRAAASQAQARVSGEPVPPSGLDAMHRRLVRIAADPPERPTWMGDRLNGVAVRLDRELSLDLATVWPYVWLTVPDTARAEITAARESLSRATTLAGWGLLYVVVGALSWPGLVVATVAFLTAWRRARAATDSYATLLDATVRLYTVDLAHQVGLPHEGPFTMETGWALTRLLQTGTVVS